MSGLPEWARPPGYGWEHRGNFSDIDVVWYHNDQVVYQTTEGYKTPVLKPVVIGIPVKRQIRFQAITAGVAASVAAFVAWAVSHIKF